MTSRVGNLVQSAVFIALGVLTPLLFHVIGLGSFMLPLFWPVAVSVFFLPVTWTVGIGMLTPVISMLITGMPPFPVLILLVIELPVLTLISGTLFQKTSAGSFISLFTGLVASRFLFLLLAALLAPLLGLPPQMVTVLYLAKSLPGVIGMLIGIPLFVHRFRGITIFRKRTEYCR